MATRKNIFYVYMYFRLNWIPLYVGFGHGNRWKRHLITKTNIHLNNVIKQAQDLGEVLPIVIVKDNLSYNKAIELEISLIKTIGREENGGPLVNKTDGGEGILGHRHSEETRAKLRRKMTPNRIKALKEGLSRMSPESIRLMKARQRKAKLGTKITESTKAKMSIAQKLRVRPPEHGQRISASKMGHEVSQETRNKISVSQKARLATVSQEWRAAHSRATSRGMKGIIRQRKIKETVKIDLNSLEI